MGDPFLGEIRAFGFNFPPRGWAFCNGQIMSIAQNQALFSLLGTTYGGNGQTTYALPDLRGRVALSSGQEPGLSNYALGQTSGEASHTLIATEMPTHSHSLVGSSAAANTTTATNNLLGDVASPAAAYGPPTDPSRTALAPNSIGATGGNQPHENRQPYLGLNFSIALQGIFPSRN